MAQAAHDIRAIWPYKSRGPSYLPPSGRTERGIGLRCKTEFPVLLCEGPHAAHCLALELSATGVVVRRGRELSDREQHTLFKLELFLPESNRPVRVLARVARRTGAETYAMRFVMISDVDRLTLMEHLDREHRDSLELLHELELSA